MIQFKSILTRRFYSTHAKITQCTKPAFKENRLHLNLRYESDSLNQLVSERGEKNVKEELVHLIFEVQVSEIYIAHPR